MQNIPVTLKGKNYSLLIGYQNHDSYREAFETLTLKVFDMDLSFEAWYQSGYWNEKYIPYTLFDGTKAVSNASVSIMGFNIFGKSQRYIQISTVATDEQYRNMGLSRFLIEHIISEWNAFCDFIYLFANRSVSAFYPKLGFTPVKQYVYSKSIKNHLVNTTFEKVDMASSLNREKLYQYAKTPHVFSNLFMEENADLIMFYCISDLKEHVYYSKLLNAFAIAIMEKNQVYLWDVFTPHPIDLNMIITDLVRFESGEVFLGFAPKDTIAFEVKEISLEDEISNGEELLIQAGKPNPLTENKVMFPLLSRA